MNENIKTWLINMYDNEIEVTKGTIRNEHIWENGYEGYDANPHTQNILDLENYIAVLEEMKDDVMNY